LQQVRRLLLEMLRDVYLPEAVTDELLALKQVLPCNRAVLIIVMISIAAIYARR